MKNHGDSGVSLVEILFAIVILGLAFSGLLAGLSSEARASAAHRTLVNEDLVLRGQAEAVKSAVRSSCGSTAAPGATWSTSPIYTAPPNYVPSPLTGSCAAITTAPLTISVMPPVGSSKSMQIVVRRP